MKSKKSSQRKEYIIEGGKRNLFFLKHSARKNSKPNAVKKLLKFYSR